MLGLDFHSTYEDVYYTNNSDTATAYPNFTKNWLNEIKTGNPQLRTQYLPLQHRSTREQGLVLRAIQRRGHYPTKSATTRPAILLKPRAASPPKK